MKLYVTILTNGHSRYKVGIYELEGTRLAVVRVRDNRIIYSVFVVSWYEALHGVSKMMDDTTTLPSVDCYDDISTASSY